MKQYMLAVHVNEDETPAPEEMEQAGRDVDALNTQLQEAGVWVFAGGLHPTSSATVVRTRDGEILTTDGPYAETKEQVGGFWIIQAPDLDAALDWAGKATVACRAPIEVRPFDAA